MIRFKI